MTAAQACLPQLYTSHITQLSTLITLGKNKTTLSGNNLIIKVIIIHLIFAFVNSSLHEFSCGIGNQIYERLYKDFIRSVYPELRSSLSAVTEVNSLRLI